MNKLSSFQNTNDLKEYNNKYPYMNNNYNYIYNCKYLYFF